MMHQEHLELIHEFVEVIKEIQPNYVRVQDPGFITFFKQSCPDLNVIFSQEMGNANIHSVKAYASQVTRQAV